MKRIVLIFLLLSAAATWGGDSRRDRITVYGNLSPEQCDTVARRYDISNGGFIADINDIRTTNPDFMFFKYFSIFDLDTAETWTDQGFKNQIWDSILSYCDDDGYNFELCYMHYEYACSLADLPARVGISNALTLSDTILSRVPLYNSNTRRWANLYNATYRGYLCRALRDILEVPFSYGGDTATVNGIFFDNGGPVLYNTCSKVSGDFEIHEDPGNCDLSVSCNTWWWNDCLSVFYKQVKDTMDAMSPPKYAMPNLGTIVYTSGWSNDYYLDTLFAYPSTEFRPNWTDQGSYLPTYVTRDSLLATRDMDLNYSMRCLLTAGDTTINYPDATHRNLLYFYTITSDSSYLYIQSLTGSDPGAGDWDTTHWCGSMDVDVGRPVARKPAVFVSGTDGLGLSYSVYLRKYYKNPDTTFIFWRPRSTSTSTLRATTSMPIYLGGRLFKVIDRDGDTSDIAYDTLNIMAGSGYMAILGESDTSITQNLSNTDKDTVTITIADDISLVDCSLDSLYFQITDDGWSTFDTAKIVAEDDTSYQFTGLTENIEYTIRVIAFGDCEIDTSGTIAVTTDSTITEEPEEPGDRPDTLEIFHLHSSLGSYWLAQEPYRAKVRIEYLLADSLDWSIKWYDYRANSAYTIGTAGFRSDCLDSAASSTDKLGLRPPYHYAMTTFNLHPSNIQTFWNQDITNNATDKARVLNDFDVPDSAANPDTTFRSTSNDVLWWETAYFQYDDLGNETEINVIKGYYQIMRDSAANHPDMFFILAAGSPLSYWSEYGNTETDNANAILLDVWARDTLQDSTTYPNFRYLSDYHMLAELNADSTNYGCLKWEYVMDDSTNSHPNDSGSGVVNDSCVIYMSKLIRNTLYDYWDEPSTDTSMAQVITCIDTTSSSLTIRDNYTLVNCAVDSAKFQITVDGWNSVVTIKVTNPDDPQDTIFSELNSDQAYSIRVISYGCEVDTSNILAVSTDPLPGENKAYIFIRRPE